MREVRITLNDDQELRAEAVRIQFGFTWKELLIIAIEILEDEGEEYQTDENL